MGDISEFNLKIRLFLKAYPWRKLDPIPWADPSKPLDQSRLAVISTAGFVPPGQEPFDSKIKGGDWSFREVNGDQDVHQLTEFHRSESFDHLGVRQDPNLAFPLDRLREAEKAGRIGQLNHRHLSFMGSLTAVGRLMKQSAPEAASLLVQDEVDLALLIPV